MSVNQAHSFGSITAWVGRTLDKLITFYEDDGSTGVALDATDVVRVKIGTVGAAPDLDLDDSATANGSVTTITQTAAPAEATLRIGQDDVPAAGTYEMEIAVVDDSETGPTDAIKHVSRGKLIVKSTMLGDVGKA